MSDASCWFPSQIIPSDRPHLLLLAGVLLVVGQLELVPGVGVVRVAGDKADQQEAQESLHRDHCYDLSCSVRGYVILMMICFQLNLYK